MRHGFPCVRGSKLITLTHSFVPGRRVFRLVCGALAATTLAFGAAWSPAAGAAQGVPIEAPPTDPQDASPRAEAAIAASTVFAEVADTVFVAARNDHSCLITAVGAVQCWKRNQYGQLGNGSNVSSSIPVQVAGLLTGLKLLALCSHHSCAVTVNGTVQCCGRNADGQLGSGGVGNSSTPVNVALLKEVIAIAAGEVHSCALDEGRGQRYGEATYCWGDNAYGQLGSGAAISSPEPLGLIFFAASPLALGKHHNCAVADQGGQR